MQSTPVAKRNEELDFIRGLAILGVLAAHHRLGQFQFGSTGVVLFYVLSGFLVSGLLFKELKNTGTYRVGRFYISRGFKIWPQFYAFLLILLGVELLLSNVWQTHTFLLDKPAINFLGELFMLQNYLGNLFEITWSLAVEEHFYVLLPLLLLPFRNKLCSSHGLKIMVGVYLTFLAIGTISRFFFVSIVIPGQTPDLHIVAKQTHQHFDALFFGVLLGYLHNFRPSYFTDLFSKPSRSFAIFFLGIFVVVFPWLVRPFSVIFGIYLNLLLAGPDLLEYVTPWMTKAKHITAAFAIGYPMIYIGFGTILITLVYSQSVSKTLRTLVSPVGYRTIGRLGYYSYAVYLWHMYLIYWFKYLAQQFPAYESLPWIVRFVAELCIPIAIGILSTETIEKYFLKVRARYFARLDVKSARRQQPEQLPA